MVAIFGACCVMADGVFTPAQSVLGAIQGKQILMLDH
jgi:K+ transporter